MLFSDYFSVTRTDEDDWFDPILNNDTPLFADPFAIFKESDPDWAGCHERLIAHFDLCFRLIAEGNRNPRTLSFRKAVDLLAFREPEEFCIGYTESGVHGSGSGLGLAQRVADAMSDAITRGLEDLQHFEELGILNEGIGPDRISDMTCNVLKPRFIDYTRDIAARHDIPTQPHSVNNGTFDDQRLRWGRARVELPTNPYNGKPVLLIPARFLASLQVINEADWFDWYQAERLRDDVNYELLTYVRKADIVAAARRNMERVRAWIAEREKGAPRPYDFNKDPKGVWLWALATRLFTTENPARLPEVTTEADFFATIERIVERYRLFVEEKGGWRLLWNDDDTEKEEQAAQLLFRGIAEYDCAANDIVLDPEVNLGRGPVDFKSSRGYAQRAHLEVKKLHNGKFWNGLSEQLPSYLLSDDLNDGWLLAIRYRDRGVSESRMAELPERVREVSDGKGLRLRSGVVDARPKRSASKL